jgi:hypothetical protein
MKLEFSRQTCLKSSVIKWYEDRPVGTEVLYAHMGFKVALRNNAHSRHTAREVDLVVVFCIDVATAAFVMMC